MKDFIESLKETWQREYCVGCIRSKIYGMYSECGMEDPKVASCLVQKIKEQELLLQKLTQTLVEISIEHPELRKTIIENLVEKKDQPLVFAMISKIKP
jgi:hypothetical protein